MVADADAQGNKHNREFVTHAPNKDDYHSLHFQQATKLGYCIASKICHFYCIEDCYSNSNWQQKKCLSRTSETASMHKHNSQDCSQAKFPLKPNRKSNLQILLQLYSILKVNACIFLVGLISPIDPLPSTTRRWGPRPCAKVRSPRRSGRPSASACPPSGRG